MLNCEFPPVLHQPIRRILELFPRGMTNEQVLWRLRAAGLRPEASDLLNALTDLLDRGEIAQQGGRWRSVAKEPVPTAKQAPMRRPLAPPGSVLRAVPATLRAVAPAPDPGDAEATDMTSLPEWSALLAYYAATQRQDPRGRIARFADGHGMGWQLVSTRGPWWDNTELSIPTSALPEGFREALSRRTVRVAALGWPVSIFPSDAGPIFAPGLILAVAWSMTGEALTLRVEGARPSLNPDWLREVRRVTPWSEAALTDRLFPEDEPGDLGSVGQRLSHALATIGGGTLRPGDLAAEIGLGNTGLMNAAALFLPDNATFTRGVADDLETIRTWSRDMRRGTALAALLDGTGAVEATGPPLLAPGPLTDSQSVAAEAALSGPLTLIQGPPGTGKSQVILSLLTSAVLSGKSVLFVARNHQALDEVENRLRAVVPDAPLLVRGRDAEGERDTNFLIVLGQIAASPAQSAGPASLAEAARVALVSAGQAADERRRAERQATQLHLALSEATERAQAVRQHLPPDRKPARLGGIRAWLARLFRRKDRIDLALPLPDLAPLGVIEARIVALRRALDLAATPGAPGPTLDVQGVLTQVAASLTRPDDPTRRHLADRAAELDFQQGMTARRLGPEDARAVLRHRPVWAVSSLSVPARVPLIPCLFDYAIFDEASQCDIASALPVLARAARAVIVGDPMQLAFVPGLGRSTEAALMDAAGLPQSGRARLAQSRNSLFDFADRRPNVRRMFLADQFRSAGAIVDYLNDQFYDRRLVGRRADDGFRPPKGYKPGVSWEDVAGQTRREDGGNVNPAEADHIVALLRRFASDSAFAGSVGVISPFNAQVALIQRRVQQGLPPADAQRLGLRIGTVDKWQGGEADVILFSLVLASGAPATAKGFLQRDRRRLNVAISRARAVCIVVGDLGFAQSSGIAAIEALARRATTPWSPPRPPFDSLWERRLFTALQDRGLQPLAQYPVGTRYLDIALDPEGVKLDVEVDGHRWHLGPDGQRKIADRLRDAELQGRGWTVRRFWVHELDQDMEGCLDRIDRDLGRR